MNRQPNPGDVSSRVSAINALANRNQVGATTALLKAADDTNAAVRKAAFIALGRMASDADIEALAKLTIKANSPEASLALVAAAQRSKDKPAAAKKLLALATNEASQIAMIEALGSLGGDEALAVVVKLTASSNAEVCEAAILALGNWSDFSAAKPLLALASDANLKENLCTPTLQAIVNLVKSSEKESADSLANAALAALNVARKDTDKKIGPFCSGCHSQPQSC